MRDEKNLIFFRKVSLVFSGDFKHIMRGHCDPGRGLVATGREWSRKKKKVNNPYTPPNPYALGEEKSFFFFLNNQPNLLT